MPKENAANEAGLPRVWVVKVMFRGATSMMYVCRTAPVLTVESGVLTAMALDPVCGPAWLDCSEVAGVMTAVVDAEPDSEALDFDRPYTRTKAPKKRAKTKAPGLGPRFWAGEQ